MQHAVTGLGDAARGTDDCLDADGGAKGVDVRDAVDGDRRDVDGVRRGTEVEAAFEVADRRDILRGSDEAAGADGQHAAVAKGPDAAGEDGVIEGADDRLRGRATVVHRQLLDGVVAEELDDATGVDGNFVAGVDGGGDLRGERALRHDEALGRVSRERDASAVAIDADEERTLVDVGTSVVGVRAFQVDGTATGLHEGHAGTNDIRAEDLPTAALGLDDELGGAGRQVTLAGGGADGLGVRAPHDDAARADGQRLACGDVERRGGDVIEAQRIDRLVGRDRDRQRDPGADVEVRGGRGVGQGVHVGCRVGVTKETVGAHRAHAVDRRVGSEVVGARADRAHDGPAADDAVGEAGRGERHAVEVLDLDAVIQAGREVGRRTEITDEVTDSQGRGRIRTGAVGDIELRLAERQGRRADAFRRIILGASAEFEVAAAHGDRGRIVEAVHVVAPAVVVLEVEVTEVQVDRRGRRQTGVLIHDREAAVDEGRAGIGQVGVEVERAVTGLGELHISRDSTREVTGIRRDHQVTRAAGAGDISPVAWDPGVVEEAVGLQRGAIEVQRAGHRGEVVVRLDGVVDAGAELERALIEDELARERIRARRGEAVDGRGDRGDRERARPVLDQRHIAAGDAVTAREGRIDRQVADRPDSERREVVREVEDTARDGRGAAGADQDTARAQIELGAIGDGEVRVAIKGERVARGVADDRRARVWDTEVGATDELQVGSGRGAGRGADDRGRISLVFGTSQRSEVTDEGAVRDDASGRKGGALPRRTEVNKRPRKHRAVGRAGSTSLARPGRVDDELDARTGRLRRVTDTTEEEGSAVGGGGLRGSRVGPGRGTAEGENRLGEARVLLRDSEHVGSAIGDHEGVEILVGCEDAAEGADEVEVTSAHRQIVIEAALEIGEATLVEVDERVVDGDGGAVLDVEFGAPGAVGIDDQRALLHHEAVAGGVGDVRSVTRFDPEGTRAVLLDGAKGGARSDRELGGAQDEVASTGETERRVTDGAIDPGVDTAHEVERAACLRGADDGAVGHGDQTRQEIGAGETLELATEVDATLDLGARGLEGDRIGPGEAARELERRTHVRRTRRDGERAGTGRGGGGEADDAGVDGQAAGPAGVIGGEDEHTGLVLEQGVREGAEGERRGQRERLTVGDREGVADGVQVERTGRGEGFRSTEASILGAVGGDRDRVGQVAEGGVGVHAQEAALDVDGLASAAEGIDAAEGQEARSGLGERETRARVGDNSIDGKRRISGQGLVGRRGGRRGRHQEGRRVGDRGNLGGGRD